MTTLEASEGSWRSGLQSYSVLVSQELPSESDEKEQSAHHKKFETLLKSIVSGTSSEVAKTQLVLPLLKEHLCEAAGAAQEDAGVWEPWELLITAFSKAWSTFTGALFLTAVRLASEGSQEAVLVAARLLDGEMSTPLRRRGLRACLAFSDASTAQNLVEASIIP